MAGKSLFQRTDLTHPAGGFICGTEAEGRSGCLRGVVIEGGLGREGGVGLRMDWGEGRGGGCGVRLAVEYCVVMGGEWHCGE